MAQSATLQRPESNGKKADSRTNELDALRAEITAIGKSQAVIEFETDGTIITANDNFLSVVGYTLNEIQGKHHSMFVEEAYRNSAEYQQFWDKLRAGEYQAAEFKRIGKGGKEVWLQASYNPILDTDGKPFKVVKYASDVTEQKKLEQMDAIVENVPINILLADTNGTIVYMNPSSEKTLRSIQHALPVPVDQIVGGSYDVFHKNPAHQRNLLADPKNLPHQAQIQLGDDYLQLNASAIFDNQGIYMGPMVAWEVVTDKVESERREKERLEQDRRQQEELKNKVDDLLAVVNAAAEGDLTEEISVTGEDAVGSLADGLRRMLNDLRDIIGQVVESANQFTEGSRVIAESSQSLAQGAQTQSSAVEQMNASIQELSSSIDGVKTNAVEADKVAKETNQLAEEGGNAVTQSIEAMDLIKTSSEQISEIIQVISEIAGQTNLLALNAAIEAARAGEHGLGFAVVADEVRKLAERSSEAAKEISSLIKESTRRVEEGATLSERTGEALTKIIDGVEATAAKISQIATATVEQAGNAQEVAAAAQNIGEVTEQNAAGSEQMASSAEELGAQASSLRDLVARFKTEK